MQPTRRQVVQMLTALGFSGPAIAALADQARRTLAADDLKGAMAIQGRTLAGDDIDVIRRALQRSLDQFQPVRDLEIDDTIALPSVFRPQRIP